ncbi:VAMP3 [Lepeophtheirus salmonis]|uniref:VAMP3 n=1 Tax=Lepeophtheirus salmonis TaxID=72036 RepID=A0A7R8CMY8_LEPSM|nr:VAMP3 [Lepeophtheirus salmonis]CAF2837494.1 VAMP3 [Lepeophtheirus salmonis]
MAESEHNASQQPLVNSPTSSSSAQNNPSSTAPGVGRGTSSSSNSTSAATNNTTTGTSSSGPPQNIQQLVASKRLQQAQAQVGEVVDIMRINVEKVLERDSKLSELDRRADDLQEGASQFQQQAVKLKRKLWWENAKMWIILGVLLLFFIAVIVLSSTSSGGSGPKYAINADERNGTLETVDETGIPGPAFTTLKKIVITTPHPQTPPLSGGSANSVGVKEEVHGHPKQSSEHHHDKKPASGTTA